MDKIIGFAPDADPTIPGVALEVDKMVPTLQGLAGQPSGVAPTGVGALAATCRGAAVITKNDDTRRLFAGTATKLYELIGTTWTDVSRVAVYTTGGDNRWAFAQFGNASIASNYDDAMQRSLSTGVFSDIATAPKARIVFAVDAFVMAMNTSDVTYGVSQDRWWCCAASNETDWTPSVSTLATTGRLVSSPGQIKAGGRLGSYAVAYKERAIYVGQFVGAPVVWDFQLVAGGEAGCVGQDAWCDVGGIHFVVGQEEMYLFDGTRVTTVGKGEVSDWFYRNSDPNQRHKVKCFYDKTTSLVHVCFASLGQTVCDKALAYHTVSKRWGLQTLQVEALLTYVTPGVTIDGLDAFSATIDGLSAYSFDSSFWLNGGRSFAHFTSGNLLRSRTGAADGCSFTTGDAGDDNVYSLLTSVRLRFEPGFKPSTATMESFTKAELGDGLTVGSTSTMYDGRFDAMDSGRWHRAKFTFGAGDVRVIGIGAALIPEGDV